MHSIVYMNLNLSKCCGQCYDGASNMSGIRDGVASQFMAEKCAVYMHCYGHDTIEQSQSWCEALETAFEISKLIKFPSREMLPLIKSRQKLLK